MRVYTIDNNGRHGGTCDSLKELDWEGETEALKAGDEIRIIIGEMTQEDFDKQSDFEGYE